VPETAVIGVDRSSRRRLATANDGERRRLATANDGGSRRRLATAARDGGSRRRLVTMLVTAARDDARDGGS
jgi:hypothetical protein